MRSWLRRILRRTVANQEPVKLDMIQIRQQFAGSWVALKDGGVVEACRTPYELVAALHERNIVDTTIIRIPGESEPELVGLG